MFHFVFSLVDYLGLGIRYLRFFVPMSFFECFHNPPLYYRSTGNIDDNDVFLVFILAYV